MANAVKVDNSETIAVATSMLEPAINYPLATHTVKGGHLSMLKTGYVHDLARKMEPYLKH